MIEFLDLLGRILGMVNYGTMVPDTTGAFTFSSPVHNVTKSYEINRNILTSMKNEETVGSASLISQYDYLSNTIGQRTTLFTSGSAFTSAPVFAWTYNERGEMVEANDLNLTQNNRAYQYDGIGNREKTVNGLLGSLPTTDNYVANSLNEYTSVKINSTVVTPNYDDDGNMTAGPLPVQQDANTTLVWDAENRLVSVTTASETTTYEYDYRGRRISKKVGNATATNYIYDGWNLIAEYAGTTLEKTYTWGMDISGSMQGAGGVGGLLCVDDQVDTFYPTYDGNGNVSEYLDASGNDVAHYEYDAFGNTTFSQGTKKDDFSHRFSTKYLDGESGLYYYGYRYYDPVTGRWPSRDPIGERGGINLYGMVGNNSIGKIDYLGHEAIWGPIVSSIIDFLDELEKCTVTVIVGHGTTSTDIGGGPRKDDRDPVINPLPDTIHGHFNQNPNGLGGIGVCYVGCNANELNDRIPEDQIVDVPDLLYGMHGGRFDAGSDEIMWGAIDSAVDAAVTKAKEFCEQDCPCSRWFVRVKFHGSILDDLLVDPDSDGDGNPDGEFQGYAQAHPDVLSRRDLRQLDGKIVESEICKK